MTKLTAGELIEKLKTFDPKTLVVVDYEEDYGDIKVFKIRLAPYVDCDRYHGLHIADKYGEIALLIGRTIPTYELKRIYKRKQG